MGEITLELKESWGWNWGAWLWASVFSLKSVGSGSGTLFEREGGMEVNARGITRMTEVRCRVLASMGSFSD